jgi:hypothetical protein
MNSKLSSPFQTHFHIRWSAGSALDWEAFKTSGEAEVTARQLAHAHESYRIEARPGACERCAAFRREKRGNLNTVETSMPGRRCKVPGFMEVHLAQVRTLVPWSKQSRQHEL